MTTLSAKLTFHIPNAFSLKDKRQVARSLIDRTRHRFNVSVAEVDTQDVLRILTVGIAVVSGDFAHARRSIDEIIRFMESHADGELIEVENQ
jgi:uncharacterized protein YlxP (DUF503 family)